MKKAAPARTTIAVAPLIRGVARSAGGFSGITKNPPLAAVTTAGSRPPYQGGSKSESCLCLQQPGWPHEQEDHEEDERHALRIAGRERRVAHGELLGERQQQPADERAGDAPDAANDERG